MARCLFRTRLEGATAGTCRRDSRIPAVASGEGVYTAMPCRMLACLTYRYKVCTFSQRMQVPCGEGMLFWLHTWILFHQIQSFWEIPMRNIKSSYFRNFSTYTISRWSTEISNPPWKNKTRLLQKLAVLSTTVNNSVSYRYASYVLLMFDCRVGCLYEWWHLWHKVTWFTKVWALPCENRLSWMIIIADI